MGNGANDQTKGRDRPQGLSIFVSHKHEDKAAALEIKRLLEEFNVDGGPTLTCHVSEHIPGGDEWLKWIKDKLRESNILLLLFTDSTRDWDWCLFETGLYLPLDPSKAPRHGRVICIYSSHEDNGPPAPIRHLQAYAATTESVELFLRQLLIDNELTDLPAPIAPWLDKAHDMLRSTAVQIAKLVSGGADKTVHHGEYVVLHIADPNAVDENQIPPAVEVTSVKDSSWELFDKTPGHWSWGDLEQEARNNEDVRWLTELAQAVYRTCTRRPVDPIQATFRSRRGGKTYRPILYRTDWNADGSVTCKILFTEDATWQMQTVEPRLGIMMSALTMGTRFRFEVLDRYRNSVRASMDQNPDETVASIREAITNIEMEAQSRNLVDQNALVGVFATTEHRRQVSGMYDTWYRIRDQLFGALEARDTEDVHAGLEKLTEINREFMTLASQRYHELVTETMS